MTEKIICFRNSLLPEAAGRERAFYDGALWSRIISGLETVSREKAESDPSYRQLVAYAVVNSGDRFLSYTRTPGTAEKRLRSKKSIGVGGHVNAGDGMQQTLFGGNPAGDFILEAMWRELDEEVRLCSPVLSRPELLCFINDDSTEVGRLHFGVAWLVKTGEPAAFLKGEKGIGGIEFLRLPELKEDIDSYENWSKIMIEYFSEGRT